MTKEKQLYVSPETEALVIRFEGMICASNPAKLMLFSDWGTSSASGSSAGADLIEDDGYSF